MFLKWGIYELLINIIDVYLAYIFLNVFFHNKLKRKLNIAIFLILQATVMLLINLIFGVGHAVGFCLMLIIWIFFCNFIYEGKKGHICLGFLIFSVLLLICEFLGLAIVCNFFDVAPSIVGEANEYRIISGITTRLIFCFVIVFVRKLRLSASNIKKIYIYELIVILFGNMLFGFIIFKAYRQKGVIRNNSLYLTFITIGAIVFSIMIIIIVEQIIKYSQKEAEWSLREGEYKRQISYIKNMENLNYKLRAQRHDFNNHIGCIYGLLDINKFEDAREYSRRLVKEAEQINNILSIDNPVIAAILNFKFNIAKEKGINIESDIKLSAEIGIEAVDISIILGNALDNALEACEKLECNKKFIYVDIYEQQQHLIIKVKNSIKQQLTRENDKYETSKADQENHGFGMKNIKYIVDKYDGLLKIEERENIFILNVALLKK